MKHAGPATVERLAPMLEQIRAFGRIVEKKPGIFYWRSRAFLHFHEHGDEVYADVRLDGADFERLPCSKVRDQASLVRLIGEWLARQPA